MQQRSPLTTQVESTLIIYYLGDLCSQTVSSNVFIDAQYEPIRGLRAMLIGSIASIPGYKWFIFLGNHFNYKSHILSLTVKVCINQTLFTPLFNTYFFGMQTLLAGGSWADAKKRVVNTVPVSWKNSWKVWPAVTAFSFTYVPWQYRNVFAGVIAVFWQTYLSWLNRKEERREVKVAERAQVQQQEIKRVEEKVMVRSTPTPTPKPKKKKKKRKVEDQKDEKT
jgi:protein Mpv17